jgi:hypothetical protein
MPPTLTFRMLTACRQSSDRGIGFLEGHGDLDAGSTFDGFEGTINGRAFRSHMDQWLDGADGPKTHFHNFKFDLAHRNCFVFKYKQHRLYGFLCHPKDTDAGFQLCSLCIYATKNERQSDKSELDRIESWRRSVAAWQAIGVIYPPKKQTMGGQSWKR